MTRSKLKIAISGLIASAIMLALFLVPGIKSPASAETWEPFPSGSGSGTFTRPDTVTADFDKVTFHGEEPAVSALKITLGNVVINGNTYNIVQNSSNACIDFKFEYYIGDQVHTTTLNYEDGGADDGYYFQCSHPNANTTVLALNVAPSASSSHFNLLLGSNTGLECVFDDVTDITKDWYLTISAVYSGQGDHYKLTFSRITFNPTTQIASFELSDIDKAYQAGYQAGLAAGGSGSGHTDEELEAARREGYNSGYGSGKADGFEEGLGSGKKIGYADGFNDGNKPGSEIFIENDMKTKFARPDNLSASCVLHTFGDGEKHAMRINFGNITLNDKVWSPYLSGTFSALSLKIKNPASNSSPVTFYCFDLSPGPGLGYDENKNNLDLTFDASTGLYNLYFAVPARGETVNLTANAKTFAISNPGAGNWTITLTAAYAAGDSNTGDTLPKVEYSSVTYNPDTYACAFVPTAADESYSDGYANGSQAGYNAGKTAGLAEGKKTGYDEGYAAGLAAAKANPGTEDKTDGKPGDTIITDKPVSWLKKNKTTLIVGSLLVVGVLVLLCIINGSSRRRR